MVINCLDKKNKIKILFFLSLLAAFIICPCLNLFAQEGDEEDRMSLDIEEKMLEIERKPAEIVIEQIIKKEEKLSSLPGERMLVEKIKVTGVTFIPEEEVRQIVDPYENKELSLKEMQDLADRISDLYFQHGYPTSRAFVPIQKFEADVLEIRVREGYVGEIIVENCRHFNEKYIRARIGLKEGEPFNGHVLRNRIHKLNKHPDRKIKVVVKPSERVGFTDIVLQVKDRIPAHLIYEVNNWNSPNTLYTRYRLVAMFTNFPGHDGNFMYDYRIGPKRSQDIHILFYTTPIWDKWKFDFFAFWKEEHYGSKYREYLMEKRSDKYWFLLHYHFIEEEDLEFSAGAGFIYKDVNMRLMNQTMCFDRIRAGMVDFRFDRTDDSGRTIVTSEMEIGIPDLWAGQKRTGDERGCLPGMSGHFVVNRLYIARRQKLFYDLQLLVNPKFEMSSDVVPGAGRFSVGGVGGISDNRGYQRAQIMGDAGMSLNIGLLFPPYIIPKDAKVPFSKATWYKALQLMFIYDHGYVWIRKPRNNEERRERIRSAGIGLRFKLPEGLSIRWDLGWPLDKVPNSNRRNHNWVQVMFDFHF